MNEQQPYEKHLADKLQQLRPPDDAGRQWPHMKALLDRDLPERGGARRWWMYGIIAGVLIIGAWIGTALLPGNNSDVVTVAPPSQQSGGAANNNSVNETQQATPQQAVSNTVADVDNPAASANPETTEKTGSTVAATNNNNNTPSKQNTNDIDNTTTNSTTQPVDVLTPVSANGSSTADKNITTRTTALNAKAIPAAKGVVSKDKSNRAPSSVTPAARDRDIAASGVGRKSQNQSAGKIDRKKTSIKNSAPNDENADAIAGESDLESTVVKPDADINRAPASTSLLAPSPMSASYASSDAMIPAARSRFKENTDRVKKLKNRIVGTGENKNMVFGLSLPLAFPLSDQKVVAYNFSGGNNTALDYLPAPHFQYHFNQKSFLQAELQVVSPQFIQPVLVAQSKYELPSTNNYRYVTNSVFARKLYYFNLPIGLHYSPFKNFYLGSGIQFSSLLSGIALHESRGYNSLNRDSLISQNYAKFKSDTISSRLNGNEFRVMLDANYYWRRFTVGLRYNQALSNYINIQVTPSSSYFTDKNKSMQFYLRYNLWENKKK
jgi:hypothetical protein